LPRYPRDVVGAANGADGLAVDQRIEELARPVEARDLRLERTRLGPIRRRAALHDARVPVIPRRRLEIVTDRHLRLPACVLRDCRTREGAGRECIARPSRRVVRDFELVRLGPARIRGVDDRQRGPNVVELCPLRRGID